MKTIPVDRLRFESGEVAEANSFAVLNVPVSELVPIVKVLEVAGARYTVVSMGHESAEAWQLVGLTSAAAARAKRPAGAYYRRRVRYKGIDYLLVGPFRLVAAEAPAPGGMETMLAAAAAMGPRGMEDMLAAAAAAEAEDDWRDGIDPQVGAANLDQLDAQRKVAEMAAEMAENRNPWPFGENVLPCPVELDAFGAPGPADAAAQMQAAAVEKVVQMKADVDAEIAAARARVEAATPEQLAQKRTPLPRGAVMQAPSMAQVEAYPFDPAPLPPLVEANLALDAAALDATARDPEAPAPFDPAPWLARAARARLVPVDRFPYDELPLGWIVPSPHNPRQLVEDEALRELADSVKARGVLQPLRVRKLAEDRFELVAGERRWHAARIAGLTFVPVVLSSATTEAEVRLEQLVENLQRQDLNPVEVARAYQAMSALGMSQSEIGAAVGKDQSRVANLLRMLALPEPVLDKIARGKLTAGHGVTFARFARWFPVVTRMAELAASGLALGNKTCSVNALQSQVIPFRDQLGPELMRDLTFGAAFDTDQCRSCPFGAYYKGVCFKPEHYEELQAAAIEAARERQDREAAEVMTAPAVGAKGGSTRDHAAETLRRIELLPEKRAEINEERARIQAEQQRVLTERRAAAEELRQEVFTRIAPDDARSVAVIAEYIASTMQPAFLREAGAACGIPESVLADTGLVTPALWKHLAGLELPRVLEFCLRLVVGRELYHAGEHGMPPVRSEWLAGRVEEGPAGHTCRQCGEGASVDMAAAMWPLDDLCEACGEDLERRGLLDDEGQDREARLCEGCGERIGAQLDRCPLCGEAELGRGAPFAVEAVA